MCVLSTVPGTVSACSGSGPSEPAPRGQADSAGLERFRRTHLRVDGVDALPRLRTRLPRSVPDGDDVLPSLLSDLPGQALMTYHPSETLFAGPQGWSSEDVMFLGADGRWRVLHMEGLGLPESAWVADTYGPGALSSDGRWWVAFSMDGPIVLNLETGQLTATDVHTYTAPPKWIPGTSTFVTHYLDRRGRSISVRISAIDGVAARTPYVDWQVGFQPDGTPIALHRRDNDTDELVEWRGRSPVTVTQVDGTPVEGRVVKKIQVLATDEHFVRIGGRDPWVVERREDTVIEVRRVHDGELTASLHLPSEIGFRDLLGWLDDETVAFIVRGHLLAYRPDDGRTFRISRLPERGYFSLDIPAAPGYY